MLTSFHQYLDSFSNHTAAVLSKPDSSPVILPHLLQPSDIDWDSILHRVEDAVHRPLKECLKKTLEKAVDKPAKKDMNSFEPEDDLRCLIFNYTMLCNTNYYYGNMGWMEATKKLRHCKLGTFLIRDSEHSGYIYTLSVQTRKGPTSCRIDYVNGQFRLDSSKDLSHKMPLFDCIPYLVDFYVHLSINPPYTGIFSPVWLNMNEDSLKVPVQIFTPLHRKVSSLQHLCRMQVVNNMRRSKSVIKIPVNTPLNPLTFVAGTLDCDPHYKRLPKRIHEYLIEYPLGQ